MKASIARTRAPWLEQPLAQVGADEAGAARHQCFHANKSFTRSGIRTGRPVAIDGRVHGVAGGQHRAVGAPDRFVIKLHAHRRQLPRPRADLHLIVVARALPVFAVRFDHRQLDAVVFHLAVGPAGLAQPVGAANLEPDQIVRVVDHAHLVGFGVAHADGRGRVPLPTRPMAPERDARVRAVAESKGHACDRRDRPCP